jgi:cation transport ATPase
VAIESAGVILIGDRLDDVVNALSLGKASYRTLTGNVVVAVLFNMVGMALAAMGLVTPPLAIMILSIFAILLNTLRIRRLTFQREALVDGGALAQAEFRVPNMVCEGCAETIRMALHALPGVQAVTPKVPHKQVSVRYELAKVQEPQLKRALAESGFSVVEV